MKNFRWVALAALWSGAGPVQAAGFLAADVLERAYQAHMALDGLDEPASGLSTPQPLGEHLFLTIDRHSREDVLGDFSLPLSALSAGIGGEYALTPLLDGVSMDLFGGMSYLHRRDDLFATDQWQGYGLGGGLRMGILDAFKLEFEVLQNALDNRREEVTSGLLRYSLGASYRLSANLGLTASYMTGEYEKDLQGQELSEWRLGARLGF